MATKKLEYKAVRLNKVSERIGIPTENLISILSNAGFLIYGNKSNFVLNNQHLEVIQQYFSVAVKNYYNEVKEDYKNLGPQRLENLKNFFAHFRSFSWFDRSISDEEFFQESLSLEKIKEYFYTVIFSYYIVENTALYKELIKLKYRLKKQTFEIQNDLRRRSSLFFFTGHYYTFTKEEDPYNAFQLTSLLALLNNANQALKEFLIDLKHLFWNQQIYLLEK